MLPCVGNTICLQYPFYKKCGGFDIGLPETRSGRDRVLPHLRLETISARNGPCPVPRKPPPESSVPGKNLPRGSRRNQLRRGHGSPPVLSEVPHELSIPMRTPKSANGPRSNSFRPDSPLTITSNRGRKTQSSLSPHRTWSVPDASSKPQLNLHNIGSAFGQTATNDTFACEIEKNHKIFEKNHKFYAIQAVENGNPA